MTSQPSHARVDTVEGGIPIGELIAGAAVGRKVLDAHGITTITGVRAVAQARVLRIHTRNGHVLEVSADHLVWREREWSSDFYRADQLEEGDLLTCYEVDESGQPTKKNSWITRIEDLGSMPVVGIDTESGEYLSGTIRVRCVAEGGDA